jgi:Ca2+-binding RTX toxin-like protein
MPIAIAPDFIINSITLVYQLNPGITALADGGFVVTWDSDEGLATGTNIRARLYSATGMAQGDDFVVNSTLANSHSHPSITALTDGRFVVTWYSYEGAATGTDIRARLYSATGVAQGDDFVINSTTAKDQVASSVTALADGRFIVTWQSDESSAAGYDYDIRARLYSATGVAQGDDFVINSTTANNQFSPKITALADGRFVVTWDSYESVDLGYDIRARLYSAAGVAEGEDFVVNSTTGGDQLSTSITALADGRLIVTWRSDEDSAAGIDIRARIYSATGVAQGDDFVINSTTAGSQFNPTITGLADGRFFVTWNTDNGVVTDNDIRGRLYSAAGVAQGDDFVINSTTVSQQFISSITALADGRLAVVWNSYENIDSGYDIRATIIDPNTFAGTEGKDIWTGGESADTIHGNGGNDSLVGGGGDDYMNGGWGGDMLRGGRGADALDGGIGGDFMRGDSGNDTVTGGAGSDRLDGGSGNDIVRGDRGNDTLVGGLGKDTLSGGGGADKYRYNTANEGSDRITSFIKGADTFQFEGSAFGLGTFSGTLAASRFDVGTDTIAATTSQRFIFNTATDQLWYDSNGSDEGGTRVMIAEIRNDVTLAAGDILIV